MEKAAASTFVVLGMHRSGTSALTRSINILGPRTSENLLGANSFNATGHWEPKSIVQFNDDVLYHFNRHWADPKPFAKNWSDTAEFSRYAAKANNLLKKEFGNAGSVVFKDPRFCRVLPVWRDAIAARNAVPVYLMSCRHPMEVAQSLARRDNLSIEHGLQLWLSYMLEAERGTRGFHRHVIHYEDLLGDWRSALRPVFQYAGVPDLETAEADQINAIDGFLAPGARHHVASRSDFEADQQVPGIVKRTYDLFLRFSETQGTGAFDQVAAQWHALWRDLSPGNDGSTYVDQMPQAKMDTSKKLEDEGRLAEALALVKQAVAGAGDNAHFHFRLGVLSHKTGDLAGAEAALRRAISLNDEPVWFHLTLAQVLGKQGDRQTEAAILRAALLRNPDHAQLYHHLGQCLEQTGDLADAVPALRRAVSLDDKPVWFPLSLARVFGKLGDRENEAATLRTALLRHPDHAQLHQNLGLCLEQTGDFAGAIIALRQAVSLNDEPVVFHLSLARVFGRLGDRDQEAATLRAALSRHPGHAQLHHNLGACLEQTGDLAGGAKASAETARLDKKVVDKLVEKMPNPLASSGTGQPAKPRRLKQFEKHALVRLLAWQASDFLADEAERLNASEIAGDSDDDPWPMGAARPIEAENPVIPPVGTPVGMAVGMSGETDKGPLLSVMIPTYEVESAKWLTHCIQGVLAQDHGPDWAEIVIIDDGSVGDVARTVAQSFAPRVKYICNSETLGLTGNFNHCISVATGKFVHILHQDDWVAPGFYAALLDPMCADDSLVAAFTSSKIVDEANEVKSTVTIGRTEAGIQVGWLEAIALNQRVKFPSIIVRRSAYEAVGGFSSSLVYSMDWDMWARLAALGPVWNDPRPLAFYRKHDGSETFRQDLVDRAIDSLRTVLRNSRLLPKDQRHPIIRAACHRLLVNANYFISHPSDKTAPLEKKNKSLHLLLRGQKDKNYIALAQALLQDPGKIAGDPSLN